MEPSDFFRRLPEVSTDRKDRVRFRTAGEGSQSQRAVRVQAFYRISQDRDNKIVILPGTAGEFIPVIDFQTFGNVADSDIWSQGS